MSTDLIFIAHTHSMYKFHWSLLFIKIIISIGSKYLDFCNHLYCIKWIRIKIYYFTKEENKRNLINFIANTNNKFHIVITCVDLLLHFQLCHAITGSLKLCGTLNSACDCVFFTNWEQTKFQYFFYQRCVIKKSI